ncbi:unnamed protein product, partial [Tilletia laevis]
WYHIGDITSSMRGAKRIGSVMMKQLLDDFLQPQHVFHPCHLDQLLRCLLTIDTVTDYRYVLLLVPVSISR